MKIFCFKLSVLIINIDGIYKYKTQTNLCTKHRKRHILQANIHGHCTVTQTHTHTHTHIILLCMHKVWFFNTVIKNLSSLGNVNDLCSKGLGILNYKPFRF